MRSQPQSPRHSLSLTADITFRSPIPGDRTAFPSCRRDHLTSSCFRMVRVTRGNFFTMSKGIRNRRPSRHTNGRSTVALNRVVVKRRNNIRHRQGLVPYLTVRQVLMNMNAGARFNSRPCKFSIVEGNSNYIFRRQHMHIRIILDRFGCAFITLLIPDSRRPQPT